MVTRGEARAAAAAAAAVAASPSTSSGGGCCLWPREGGSPGSVAVRIGLGEGGWLGVGLGGVCGGRAVGAGSLRGGVLGGGGGGAGAGAELLLLLLLVVVVLLVLVLVLLVAVLRLLLLPVLLPLPRREGPARGVGEVGEVGEVEDGGERVPGLRVAAAAGAAATIVPDMSRVLLLSRRTARAGVRTKELDPHSCEPLARPAYEWFSTLYYCCNVAYRA